MRTRKPTNGRVTGVKFTVNNETEDLKKVRAQTLKDLKEKEKDNKDWYDKELEKNLGKA
ncbi:MAG: hypothetical protein KF744_06520 [Taibaiella sp.]|nr:hypothetical protein [Taibaiella sp.]